MFSTLNTAVSALEQFQQDMSVIGNNMANVNTTAFKDASMNFEDTLSQAIGLGGGNLQVGSGVTTSAIASNFNQGTISSTGVGSGPRREWARLFRGEKPQPVAHNSSRGMEVSRRTRAGTDHFRWSARAGLQQQRPDAPGDIKIDADRRARYPRPRGPPCSRFGSTRMVMSTSFSATARRSSVVKCCFRALTIRTPW